MKKINLFTMIGIMALVMFASNAYATWYRVSITNVIPRPAGNVDLKFVPGEGIDSFSGKCVAHIDETDAGANQMLATILTAVSLNKELTINLEFYPSVSANQPILGVGLAVE